ncbi:peptidyl-prolyl cis-trans isomerase [Variovorax ginsengisoli]|uniref:Peptidyl-prolyl cis-trans isomerase n=1 Tax=Variovorax guangxiensis TaxID=1775474 RepID=A0A502DYT9_9BURK|nr:peptidyl-prolyl cis-trans isomerase [Variovorax ginsengisoli]TPG30675.1 peptidyl-prolyl cis-trans isomerase [Variovorax guangxiensis]
MRRRAACAATPLRISESENLLTLNHPSRRTALILAATLALAGNGWAQGAAPRVKLTTSAGDIVLELAPDKAPKTVANFLQYVKDKHYDGTIFHRVIDGFMVQGGGFTADMRQKPTRAPVPLEASNGLKNAKYTIAMARTGDPNSATAQFFVNVKDNAMLDAPNPDGHGYTVFGKVVSGAEVVDKIRVAQTGNKGGMQNVPLEPITIQSATVVAK